MWLAGKKRLRHSSRRRLEQIGRHWLLPVLDGVLLERINAPHSAMVFDRIELFNDELGLVRPRQGRWRAVRRPVQHDHG